METTNPDYFIIDLKLSQRLKVLSLQGLVPGEFTYRLDRARRVPEGELITKLDIYDNGDTTRAILCGVLAGYQGDPMKLAEPFINPYTLQGENTWLKQRFQKVI